MNPRPATTAAFGPRDPRHPRHPRGTRAFTLIELLLSIVICSVVLAAVSGILFGAMRLRNRTTRTLEDALPLQQTLALLRRDLSGIVPPGGPLAGPFSSGATSASSSNGTNANTAELEGDMAIFTSSGVLGDRQPWGDLQKVSYALRAPTNRINGLGRDLYRIVSRNLLPALEEQPQEQWLMGGVERLEFAFYDGTTWRSSWDSTNETTVLPKAVRVQLTVVDAEDARRAEAGQRTGRLIQHPPVQLVVPVTATVVTNQTASAAGGQP